MKRSNSNRNGLTHLEIFVVVIILIILIALLLPNVEQSRGDFRRMQCRNNLKNLALGLYEYENRFNHFPAATTIADANSIVQNCKFPTQRTGGFSWRVAILPFIEHQDIYGSIDFNGTARVLECSGNNGPPNATWTEGVRQEIFEFLCPVDETPTDIDAGWYGSNYAAMISSRADYRLTDDLNHPTMSRPQDIGVLHPEKLTTMKEVEKDGTSCTIMLVEVDRKRSVVNQGRTTLAKHPRCGRWFNSRGCFADASRTPQDFETASSIKFDEASFDLPAVWDHFVGRNTHGWGRTASSAHHKGAMVGFADGSVFWLTGSVDLELYKATCTRNGGETETVEF